MIRSLTFFILVFAVTAITPAFAQDQSPAIGTIAEVEGAAAIQQSGQAKIAEVGQDVHMNDIIETGPDSKLMVLFIDETELTLGEESRLTVDEYVFDPEDPADNKGRFSVLRGAFIFTTGLIKKGQETPDVQIETAYGSIGIRGTTVWGGPIDDEYNVFVQDGEVSFATDRGRVRIRPGEGTKVYSRSAIPDRARKWGEAKIGRATQTVALKNQERVKERVAAFKQKHQAMRTEHRAFILDKIQQKRDLQQENRQQLQDNRREKSQEHRPVKPEAMEKRSEIKEEKREQFRENVQKRQQEKAKTGSKRITPENRPRKMAKPAEKEEPVETTGNPANDLELQEKRHIKRNKRP
ncbi:MAG: FecR domain-containing protein [Rhodospirillales bacterium]|nr:FecR domain-containing protein [Rhodospirillales bacterium]MCB9995310.1 FecR domain-containing protein [Rhodospirillales bacterium]